jgi:hypothetical protein
MSIDRDTESQKDLESTSSEEENMVLWEIEKLSNLDMTSCTMLELQNAIAFNSALNSIKDAFYEAFESAFNELHQLHLSANVTGTSQYTIDVENILPNPFKEMEVVLKDLAKMQLKFTLK